MVKEIKVSPGGYYYAEVTSDECLQWGGLGVCDLCGKNFDKGYLVWVLSDCICQSCFDDWMTHQTRYEEDGDDWVDSGYTAYFVRAFDEHPDVDI